jgi:Leucine-rich repeat (LRR) protein
MDLDSDNFFGPRIRNVIVLDDLKSTAAEDPRINDLFTEGSHHHNLSVVTLNQNLFSKKTPPRGENVIT